MSANTKSAANLELRPLENHQLEMAHAVDAIDTLRGMAELAGECFHQRSSISHRFSESGPETQKWARA
jgi:hypothetical protein